MTFVPVSSAELRGIREQRRKGWSVAACAAHWRRDAAEIEIVLWLMLGRWRLRNITASREVVNRCLAKRVALKAVSELLGAK